MQKEAGDKIHKFFVNSKDQATILCAKCGSSKTVDVAKLNVASRRFKVTCKCGESFRAEIEYRKNFRKPVKLPGKYIHLNSPKRGELMVVNLSTTGLGFMSTLPHRLQVGDHLEVFFRLDNSQRSEIRLKVVVRRINDRFVGVERTDTLICIQDLAFYLM